MAEVSTVDNGLAYRIGVTDESVKDDAVAGQIQKNVRGVFSWVRVETMNFSYQGVPVPLRSRVITVSLSTWQSVQQVTWQSLRSLVALAVKELRAPPSTALNINYTVHAILGSKTDEDVAELFRAGQDQIAISIAMSFDRNHISVTNEPARIFRPIVIRVDHCWIL